MWNYGQIEKPSATAQWGKGEIIIVASAITSINIAHSVLSHAFILYDLTKVVLEKSKGYAHKEKRFYLFILKLC